MKYSPAAKGTGGAEPGERDRQGEESLGQVEMVTGTMPLLGLSLFPKESSGRAVLAALLCCHRCQVAAG